MACWRESKEKWLRDGRSKLADASPLTTPRETTVTRPTLRASFEVNLCPILKRSTPLQRPCNKLNEDGLLARIQREMTAWRSFEISRRFAAHPAESLAANRWSLRHLDHEEVTNHSAHWTPLIRIHTYNEISQSESFETAITHEREDFFAFCFFVREARGDVRSQWKKRACAYDVRKAPIHDLLTSIHKTRGFEWQTAHTKGCQENRCGLIASTDLWPQEMFIFFGNACAGRVWTLFRCLRLS